MASPYLYDYTGPFTLEKTYESEKLITDRISVLYGPTIAKRTYICALALIKNIQYYSSETSIQPGGRITGNGSLRITALDQTITIAAVNLIPKSRLQQLLSSVADVNRMEQHELQSVLTKRMQHTDGGHPDNGLGLITIRSESGSRLGIEHTDTSDGNCRVLICVTIGRE